MIAFGWGVAIGMWFMALCFCAGTQSIWIY